jgi:NAD/NADP transhydrogenase beta subunit
MTFAICFTFLLEDFQGEFLKFIVSFVLGGAIGVVLAMRVEMINMP